MRQLSRDTRETFDTKHILFSISLLGAGVAFTVSTSELALTAAGIVITMAIATWILGFTLVGTLMGMVAGLCLAAMFHWLSGKQVAGSTKTERITATSDSSAVTESISDFGVQAYV